MSVFTITTKKVDNVHHFWTDLSTLPQLSIWSYHCEATTANTRRAHLAGQTGGLWKHLPSANSSTLGKAVFGRDSRGGHLLRRPVVPARSFPPGFLSRLCFRHSSPLMHRKRNTEVIIN